MARFKAGADEVAAVVVVAVGVGFAKKRSSFGWGGEKLLGRGSVAAVVVVGVGVGLAKKRSSFGWEGEGLLGRGSVAVVDGRRERIHSVAFRMDLPPVAASASAANSLGKPMLNNCSMTITGKHREEKRREEEKRGGFSYYFSSLLYGLSIK